MGHPAGACQLRSTSPTVLCTSPDHSGASAADLRAAGGPRADIRAAGPSADLRAAGPSAAGGAAGPSPDLRAAGPSAAGGTAGSSSDGSGSSSDGCTGSDLLCTSPELRGTSPVLRSAGPAVLCTSDQLRSAVLWRHDSWRLRRLRRRFHDLLSCT